MGTPLRRTSHISTQQLWVALQRERDELVKEKIETDLCERIRSDLGSRLRGEAGDVDSALYEALHSLLRNPSMYDSARGEISGYVFGAARHILARRAKEARAANLKHADYSLLMTVRAGADSLGTNLVQQLLDSVREHVLRALTRKEREIYELSCAGFTPREIQRRLHRPGKQCRPSVRSVRVMKSRTNRKVKRLLQEVLTECASHWA